MHNLNRVQGYLEVLQAEIEDPSRRGSGFDKKEWEQRATELQANLELLGSLLNSKTWK